MEIKYAPGAEVLIRAKVESVKVYEDQTEYRCLLPGYNKTLTFNEEEIVMELVDTSQKEIEK